jgi:hypothetical protein
MTRYRVSIDLTADTDDPALFMALVETLVVDGLTSLNYYDEFAAMGLVRMRHSALMRVDPATERHDGMEAWVARCVDIRPPEAKLPQLFLPGME